MLFKIIVPFQSYPPNPLKLGDFSKQQRQSLRLNEHHGVCKIYCIMLYNAQQACIDKGRIVALCKKIQQRDILAAVFFNDRPKRPVLLVVIWPDYFTVVISLPNHLLEISARVPSSAIAKSCFSISATSAVEPFRQPMPYSSSERDSSNTRY